MNPRLQAYLLQYIDHDEMTVDQGERGDKAIIEDLRRQLETAKSALEAVPDHGLTPENSGTVIENVNTAYASVTDAMSELAAVTAKLADFRERFYDEVWQNAGCLTLAEGNTDYPPEHLQSIAMKTVIALRQERDRYRTALETINTGMIGDWTPAAIAGQALEGGE